MNDEEVIPPPAVPREVSPLQRMLSAMGGSLLTSLATTPLDVVKTRQQSTVHVMTGSPASGAPRAPSVPPTAPTAHTPTANHISSRPAGLPSGASLLGRGATPPATVTPSSSAVSATRTLLHVWRTEGLRTLWSGLSPTLMASIPATAVYFTAYEELRDVLERRGKGSWVTSLAPLLAGTIARTAVVSVTSPLELIRTKMQANKVSYGVWAGLKDEVQTRGVRALWRGWAPTLYRDVPFSAVYWLGYERLRESLGRVAMRPASRAEAEAEAARPRSRAHVHATLAEASFGTNFVVSFLAGALSGSLAATITTPFDVVKTRRQVLLLRQETTGLPSGSHTSTSSTRRILEAIAREEGMAGLFSGLAARVAKVAPACAIMISSYEVGKRVCVSCGSGSGLGLR